MTDQDGNKQQKGGGILALLRRPSTRYSLGGILVVGIVAGIIFWGGFNTALEATNTETFCISCHEMGNNVYPEYKETIHYSNRTGVRATCPDCHVPRDWTHKMVRAGRGLQGTVGQDRRHHRHPGEVRSQAADAGPTRMGADAGIRFP